MSGTIEIEGETFNTSDYRVRKQEQLLKKKIREIGELQRVLLETKKKLVESGGHLGQARARVTILERRLKKLDPGPQPVTPIEEPEEMKNENAE